MIDLGVVQICYYLNVKKSLIHPPTQSLFYDVTANGELMFERFQVVSDCKSSWISEMILLNLYNSKSSIYFPQINDLVAEQT